MIPLATLGIAGGLLALLIINHFVVDWIFQTHNEAMAKHNNAKVRAKHCLIYTLGFVPLLLLMHMPWLYMLIALNILFWSHFVEDTYLPVYLWAKYIRKPPEMTEPIVEEGPPVLHIDNAAQPYKTEVKRAKSVLPPDPKTGFVKFINTTLGKILMIAVDQIIHILFLIPVVILAML